MLKRSLKRCVDWSQIDKNDYLKAMRESVADSMHIKALVQPALTTKINDREMFMKGIDYSYYYEQEWETISYGTTNDKTINKKNIINNL